MPRFVLKNVRVYPPLLLASVVCLFGFVAYAHDDVRAAYDVPTDEIRQDTEQCSTAITWALKRRVVNISSQIGDLLLDLDSRNVFEDDPLILGSRVLDLELPPDWRRQVDAREAAIISQVASLVTSLKNTILTLQDALSPCPTVKAAEVIIYSPRLDGDWETGEAFATAIIQSTEEVAELISASYYLYLLTTSPEPFLFASLLEIIDFPARLDTEIRSNNDLFGTCPDDAVVSDSYTASYLALPDMSTTTQSFKLTVTVVCVDSEAYWR